MLMNIAQDVCVSWQSIHVCSLLKARGHGKQQPETRAVYLPVKKEKTERQPFESILPHRNRNDVPITVSKKAVDTKIGFGWNWILAANGWFLIKCLIATNL